MNRLQLLPVFPFTPPVGYQWLVDRGLVGFTAFSALQPWYFLSREDAFVLEGGPWFAFARRQDNDDVACFASQDGTAKVVVVHGWTPTGHQVVATHDTVWDWFRSVVDEIAEWAALAAGPG